MGKPSAGFMGSRLHEVRVRCRALAEAMLMAEAEAMLTVRGPSEAC